MAGEARLGGRQQDLERDVELDGVRQEDRRGEQQDDDLGQPGAKKDGTSSGQDVMNGFD